MAVPAAPKPDTRPEAASAAPDPFLIPSAATIRFLLLMVTSLSASLALLGILLTFVGLVGLMPVSGVQECIDTARSGVGVTRGLALLNEFNDCLDRAGRGIVLMLTLASAIPVLVGAAVYTAYPWMLMRRFQYPDSVETSLHHQAEGELRLALGSSPYRVRLLITRGNTGGARAFGAWGRYWIAIDRSLLATDTRAHGTIHDSARAVIFHEAAHVRNRDIDVTYLTIGIWWGFAVTAFPLFPLLFSRDMVFTFGLPFIAALAALSYARARVLQSRECYADVRAARNPQIRRCMVMLFSRSGSRPSWSTRVWRELSGRHPKPETRRAIVENPSLLLKTDYLDLVYAGCVVGLSYSTLHLIVPLYAAWTLNVLGLAFGALLSVILTTAAWRTATLARFQGQHRLSVARGSLALTGGILLGQLMVPFFYTHTWGGMLVTAPLSALLAAVLLWGGCAVAVGSISFAASCWIGLSHRLWPLWACAAAHSMVVAVILSSWFFTVYSHAAHPGWWSVVYWIYTSIGTTRHLVVAGLGLAIAFPLLSWLSWRLRPTGVDRSLDSGPRSRLLCPPWLPIAVALVTTACFIATMGIRSRAGSEVPPLLIGILLTVIATMTLSWILGGRGATARTVCTTAVTVYFLAPAGLPAIHIGNRIGICLDHPTELPGCLADVLPGIGSWISAVNTSVIPLLPLLLVCCPIAAVVSKARGILGRPPRPLSPPVRRWPSVAATLVILLMGLGSPLLILYARGPSKSEDTPRPLDAPVRTELLRPFEGGPLDHDTTCDVINQNFADSLELGPTQGSDGLYVSRARSVLAMANSTDPAMRVFGETAIEHVDEAAARDVLGKAYSAGSRYCRIVNPDTGESMFGW